MDNRMEAASGTLTPTSDYSRGSDNGPGSTRALSSAGNEQQRGSQTVATAVQVLTELKKTMDENDFNTVLRDFLDRDKKRPCEANMEADCDSPTKPDRAVTAAAAGGSGEGMGTHAYELEVAAASKATSKRPPPAPATSLTAEALQSLKPPAVKPGAHTRPLLPAKQPSPATPLMAKILPPPVDLPSSIQIESAPATGTFSVGKAVPSPPSPPPVCRSSNDAHAAKPPPPCRSQPRESSQFSFSENVRNSGGTSTSGGTTHSTSTGGDNFSAFPIGNCGGNVVTTASSLPFGSTLVAVSIPSQTPVPVNMWVSEQKADDITPSANVGMMCRTDRPIYDATCGAIGGTARATGTSADGNNSERSTSSSSGSVAAGATALSLSILSQAAMVARGTRDNDVATRSSQGIGSGSGTHVGTSFASVSGAYGGGSTPTASSSHAPVKVGADLSFPDDEPMLSDADPTEIPRTSLFSGVDIESVLQLRKIFDPDDAIVSMDNSVPQESPSPVTVRGRVPQAAAQNRRTAKRTSGDPSQSRTSTERRPLATAAGVAGSTSASGSGLGTDTGITHLVAAAAAAAAVIPGSDIGAGTGGSIGTGQPVAVAATVAGINSGTNTGTSTGTVTGAGTGTTRRRKTKRSCEACYFVKARCDDARPCGRCVRLRKDNCVDRVLLKRDRQKYKSKLGGTVVPFLPVSYLAMFGLPSDAFDVLKSEPTYTVTDMQVHLQAVARGVVRTYEKFGHKLKIYPQRAMNEVRSHVDNLGVPGTLMELELMAKLKPLVGLGPGVEIPQRCKKITKYRDHDGETSEFFPPVVRREMNARCGVVRWKHKFLDDDGNSIRTFNCNGRLRDMYGYTKKQMDEAGFPLSPRFVHPDDWSVMIEGALLCVAAQEDAAAAIGNNAVVNPKAPEKRTTIVQPVRMLTRSGRMAPVIFMAFESSRTVTEHSFVGVLVPVVT